MRPALIRSLCLLTTVPLALSSCALLAVGAVTETGIATVEDRSYGTKIDDTGIYVNVNDQLLKSGSDGLATATTVNVRYARVMLTGNVATQAMSDQAAAAAWKAKGVKEVINELVVNPDSTYGQAANDLLVKKNLDARLYLTKDVWKINYSTDVVGGTAYLLGRAKDRDELNRVLNVARTTKGIKRVVNHIQVASELPGDANSGGNVGATSAAAPVAPVNNNSTSAAPMAPTDGTIATESIDSSDLGAPAAPAPAPAAPKVTPPTWK